MGPPRLTKIGKYEVIEIVGRGGMGVVYKAVDPAIGRLVAIKMMTGGFGDDPELLKRFYREAKSTGSLQHPNIVTVYELGDQQSVPYLVMEFLEGQSLEALIRSSRDMAIAEKLSFVVQVCDGLDYAHRRNVIHRDIKPANIVVTKDGGVKIVDFGIARFGNERFTKTGQVMGSINYMSPEQINGEDTDSRTDIYSAGIVLFEFLTGELPFRGKDTSSTLMKILHDPVPSLSVFLKSYPAELDQVIARALAKKRDDRYSAIEDFGFDVQRIQEESRRQIIAGYLSTAEDCVAQCDWNKAKESLRQVLKLDRQHTRANELVRHIQTQLQKQQKKDQLRQLRSRAEEALGQREWDEALGYIEQAIEIDTTDPTLVALRDSVRKSKDSLNEALHRAESANQAGELDAAKKAVEDALAVDPSDSRARALKAIVSKELADRSKRQAVEALLNEARQEVSARRFTAALDLLKKAEVIDPGAPDVQQMLAFAATAREQEKRKQALEQTSAEIEELLNRDEYGAASAKADEALLKFPKDPGLLRLRAFAEKQREAWKKRLYIESQLDVAHRLLDEGENLNASGVLQEALQKYPDDPSLLSLSTIVNEAVVREQNQHAEAERKRIDAERDVQTQVTAVKSLLDGGQVENAAKAVEEALMRHPDHSELKTLAATAHEELLGKEAERAELDRKARLDRAEIIGELKVAEQLLSAKNPGKAVSMLEETLRRYPQSEELRSLLSKAREQLAREGADPASTERKAADQRRKAEEQKRLEEFNRDRARDLAELRSLAASSQAETDFAELTNRSLRVQELAGRYGSDPEVQALASRGSEVLNYAITSLGEAPHSSPPRSAARTRLFSEGVVDRPARPAHPGRTIHSTSVSAPPPWGEPTELYTPNPPARRNTMWIVLSVLVAVLVAAIVIRSFWSAPGSVVNVQTTPVGASVQVGTHTCVTPNCSLKLSPGTYKVQAQLDGYQDASQSLTVSAGQQESTISLTLEPATKTPGAPGVPGVDSSIANPPVATPSQGTLVVKTGLPGVDILINGKRRGVTGTDGSLQLPLDSRQYNVLAQRSGFVSAFEQSVRITKGQETTISLDLRPMAKSAFLSMTGLPPGEQVVANGLPLGTVGSDGNFSRSLDIGDYEIGVTKDGRQSAVVRKHLRTGQTLNLTGADLKFPATGAAHTAAPSSKATTPSSGNAPPVAAQPTTSPNNATPAPLAKLRVSSQNIRQGESAILSWETQNATEASIEGLGSVTPTGSRLVTPPSSTTYRLMAKGPGGTITDSFPPITVASPPAAAATPAPTPAASAPASGGPPSLFERDRQDIKQAIDRWKSAYESESLDDMKQAWPSISKDQQKKLKDTFNSFNAIKVIVNYQDKDIRINGSGAEVDCQQVMRYTLKGKVQPDQVNPVSIRLNKRDGTWVVANVAGH
jgi:serine/threonine protein kinase